MYTYGTYIQRSVGNYYNLQGAVAVLSENSYAQFYGKFRSSAPKVKVCYKSIHGTRVSPVVCAPSRH